MSFVIDNKSKVKKALIKVFSFLLCLFVLLNMFSNIPFTQAHAEPVTATIAVGAAGTLAEILLIIGISVGSIYLVHEFVEELQAVKPEIIDWVNEVADRVDNNGHTPNDGGKISISALDLGMLTMIKQLADDFFPSGSGTIEVETEDTESGNYNLIGDVLYTTVMYTSAQAAYSAAPYSSSDSVVFDYNNKSYNYHLINSYGVYALKFNDTYGCTYYVSGNSGTTNALETYNGRTTQSARFGFYKSVAPGFEDYINPYIAYTYYDGNNVLQYGYIQPSTKFALGDLQITTNPTFPIIIIDVPYTNVPEVDPDKVIQEVGKKSNEDENDDGQPDIIYFPNPLNLPDETINTTDKDQTDELTDIGILPDGYDLPDPLNPDSSADPNYRPDPELVPDIDTLWDYVGDFVSNALIWMQLWYTGFLQLPIEVQWMLWAILVIIIVTGLLGVFLR